ncbi:LamG-like jellyroll fold domain-containing protein [Tropicibacter sp. S64]|uniref:LamG-like jellyroll fold domain-containing protein n=1 Tax=Tropicibacter sp. S64 TaxID=3415122 RepID=UPI003C7A14EF
MFKRFLLAAGVVLSAGSVNAATLMHEFTFDNTDFVGVSGTMIGNTYVSGGQAHFDGAGDYIDLYGYLIPTEGADFSVVLTATATLPLSTNYMEMVSQGKSGGGFYIGHGTGSSANNTRQMRLTDNHINSGVLMPSDGLAHTYVLTSGNAFGTKFYIDGTEVFSGSELNLAPSTATGATQTRLGAQFQGFGEYFRGSIDYFAVYSGELANGMVPTSEVPLPASLPLLLAGLGGVAALRRRRG